MRWQDNLFLSTDKTIAKPAIFQALWKALPWLLGVFGLAISLPLVVLNWYKAAWLPS
jgi:hypothetical protein